MKADCCSCDSLARNTDMQETTDHMIYTVNSYKTLISKSPNDLKNVAIS